MPLFVLQWVDKLTFMEAAHELLAQAGRFAIVSISAPPAIKPPLVMRSLRNSRVRTSAWARAESTLSDPLSGPELVSGLIGQTASCRTHYTTIFRSNSHATPKIFESVGQMQVSRDSSS